MNANGLRKKLINGLVIDKWDLVKIIESQEKRIAELEKAFVQQRTQAFANSLTDGTKAGAMQQVLSAEPVAWRKVTGSTTKYYEYNEIGEGEPLYTTPQEQRERIAELEAMVKGTRTIWDKPQESEYLKNVSIAAKANEEG